MSAKLMLLFGWVPRQVPGNGCSAPLKLPRSSCSGNELMLPKRKAIPEGSQVLCVTHGGLQASSERHIDVEANARTAANLQRARDGTHL